MSFVNYRCVRCFSEFKALNGPIDCPNCEFKYVVNVDEYNRLQQVKKEQAAFAEKKAVSCLSGDDVNLDPPATCDCG